MKKEKILVDREKFLNILERSLELEALEVCGVDNWLYYGDAQAAYLENYGKETLRELAEDELRSSIQANNYLLTEHGLKYYIKRSIELNVLEISGLQHEEVISKYLGSKNQKDFDRLIEEFIEDFEEVSVVP